MNSNGSNQFRVFDNINIPLANSKNTENKHVLIVEDNEINMKIIKVLLKLLGYQYLEAYDGRQALDILNQKKVELILMDIQMPVLNGFETTKIIRQTEELKGNYTTIVAMTANAMTGDKELCLEIGMDDYISKPLYFTKLKELLIKYL
jgi:CheY-like chemotaxis protein